MQIQLTPAARAFLAERGVTEVTIASLVFSSCCSGPLPPEVKPGAPVDTEGFYRYEGDSFIFYVDSLLDPRPDMIIDLKDYGSYRELFIQGWE
jgi:hypothetical protein